MVAAVALGEQAAVAVGRGGAALAHFTLEASRAACAHSTPREVVDRAFDLLEQGWGVLARSEARANASRRDGPRSGRGCHDRAGLPDGGLLLLPVGLVSGLGPPLRIDAVGAVMFLGLVPTAVAHTSYFAGLHHAGAAAGVVAVLLEPLTATLLAVLFGHDRLGAAQILGAFLVMVPIGVQQAPVRTPSHREHPLSVSGCLTHEALSRVPGQAGLSIARAPSRRGIKPTTSPHPKDGPSQAASRGRPTTPELHQPPPQRPSCVRSSASLAVRPGD
ncbi:EamA family transporter [Streptomyces sp. NPDC057238]|uniref:EamA family transporter n=1 Tax=Streptomyces sp. NPDC057238 TaxID=3346060 RepID=UPI00362A2A11